MQQKKIVLLLLFSWFRALSLSVMSQSGSQCCGTLLFTLLKRADPSSLCPKIMLKSKTKYCSDVAQMTYFWV